MRTRSPEAAAPPIEADAHIMRSEDDFVAQE